MARAAVVALAGASLAACATSHGPPPGGPLGVNGTMKPYQVNGVWYRPAEQPGYDKVGMASWYGPQSHYHTTADGEAFDPSTPSAAHKTLPLPCIVEVTNLDNGRKIRVRVNDRGPFVDGRILDVSRQAANDLGFLGQGMARVRVRYIGPAPLVGRGETARYSDGASRAMARAEPLPAPVSAPPSVTPAPVASAPAAAWRIQAGAFADRGNAERAAQTLSSRGQTSIEPVDRGGDRLWRVTVSGAPGETPEDLRGQVASQGFPGAKVIGPS
jgi:rare lipoprotein A